MSEDCAGALISGHDSVRRVKRKRKRRKALHHYFIVQFYVSRVNKLLKVNNFKAVYGLQAGVWAAQVTQRIWASQMRRLV